MRQKLNIFFGGGSNDFDKIYILKVQRNTYPPKYLFGNYISKSRNKPWSLS